MHAANTLAEPERVGLRDNTSARLVDGTVTITLPPVSWTALELS
jgi:alpha-N-arabinofuranosidase